MKEGQGADTDAKWSAFAKRYRGEMRQPDAARTLELLARLSKDANFSLGCYCQDEAHCHRSILRDLLTESGAAMLE